MFGRRIVRNLGVAVAALALAGCSTDFHPGTAAVVDGTSISQNRVDDVTTAFCAYLSGLSTQGGQTQQISISDAKAGLTNAMVQTVITTDVADKLGLTVSQSAIDTQKARYGLPQGLNASEKATLDSYFDEVATASLLQAVIGAHLKDKSVTSVADLSQAQIDVSDLSFMNPYYEAADVDLNPVYGTWDGKKLVPGDGSLSELATSSTQSVPDAQKCQ